MSNFKPLLVGLGRKTKTHHILENFYQLSAKDYKELKVDGLADILKDEAENLGLDPDVCEFASSPKKAASTAYKQNRKERKHGFFYVKA